MEPKAMNAAEYRFLYELEEHYWWFVGMRKIIAALLDPFVRPGPLRILDAGCGTGSMLKWLRQRYSGGRPVVGTDISPDGLSYCRKRGEQLLVQGSVERLPFPDGFFDLVTTFDVLVLLGPAAAQAALAELTRVVRRGGHLVVRVAAYQWLYGEHDRATLTVHRYTASELKQALLAQGLVLERLTYANSLLFPPAVAWRWLHRSHRPEPQSDVRPLPKALRWLNLPLTGLLALEAAWLRYFPGRLPAGLSVIALARKPTGA